MKINNIDHLVITTENLAGCLHFYRDVLGMDVVRADGRYALRFGREKINIHTRKGEFQPAAKVPAPGSLDLCLIADGDIDEIREEIAAKHWPIEEGPVERHGALGKMQSIYLRDPDGSLIEISSYAKRKARNLQLVKLAPDAEDRAEFAQINREAFPPSEYMSFDELFAFAADTNTDILGIYDEETPVGFTVLLKNEVCAYIYFLAIDKKVRGEGCGSAALREIREMYAPLQIILDFEIIDPAAENLRQRIRRKHFYLGNGFHETGCFTVLRNNYFEVVCSGGELKKDAFRDLIRIIHAHQNDFPDVLIEG